MHTPRPGQPGSGWRSCRPATTSKSKLPLRWSSSGRSAHCSSAPTVCSHPGPAASPPWPSVIGPRQSLPFGNLSRLVGSRSYGPNVPRVDHDDRTSSSQQVGRIISRARTLGLVTCRSCSRRCLSVLNRQDRKGPWVECARRCRLLCRDIFRSTGPGWQTRIDEALRRWVERHRKDIQTQTRRRRVA